VERIEKAARQGPLERHGLTWLGATVRVGSTLLGPGIGTAVAGLGELLGIADSRRATSRQGPVTVWTKLVEHGRMVQQELDRVQTREGENLAGGVYWGIPPSPTMNVVVTAGLLLMDSIPEADQAARIGKGATPRCTSRVPVAAG
jgi:hypothetical protein